MTEHIDRVWDEVFIRGLERRLNRAYSQLAETEDRAAALWAVCKRQARERIQDRAYAQHLEHERDMALYDAD